MALLFWRLHQQWCIAIDGEMKRAAIGSYCEANFLVDLLPQISDCDLFEIVLGHLIEVLGVNSPIAAERVDL